jgi:hypothetical protein
MPLVVGKLYSIDKQSITQNDTCEIFTEKLIVRNSTIINF